MIKIAILALVLTGAAHAEGAPNVYALTPAQKAQVLESASLRPDADNPALLPALPDRRPHGEVGVMVGTGGARGVYGVVGAPVGDSGSAVVAFSNNRLPRGHGRGFYGGGAFGVTTQQDFGFGLRQPGW